MWGGPNQVRVGGALFHEVLQSHWRCATKVARTEKKAYSVAKMRNKLAVQEESIFSGCSD